MHVEETFHACYFICRCSGNTVYAFGNIFVLLELESSTSEVNRWTHSTNLDKHFVIDLYEDISAYEFLSVPFYPHSWFQHFYWQGDEGFQNALKEHL